jgi:hypothetical protein
LQRLQQFDHEERVALGATIDIGDKSIDIGFRKWALCRHEFLDLVKSKRTQGDPGRARFAHK